MSISVRPAEKREKELPPPRKNPFRRFFVIVGPGLMTGAADDDPSSIGTYSVVGAQLGTSMLWTALVTWPLIAVVQMVCARIGILTGGGLARALTKKLPRPLVATMALALLVTNTITVGADLSAMADAAEMLSGINSHYYVVLFGIVIGLGTLIFRYRHLANFLKWFAFSLFAYVLTAFWVQPDWPKVLHDTFYPTWPSGTAAWTGLVALLGATISPYLFFWQASLELEEKHDPDPDVAEMVLNSTAGRLRARRIDVAIGTFFSNLAMYFIILTTGLTLHRNGVTNIDTSREAAAALVPLAGPFAASLFTIGIVGVGLVAIPALITSSAHALAESFRWRHGLHHDFQAARPFYAVIILSCLIGMGLDFTDVSPLKALYWAAIISGLIAPFLLVGLLLVAADRKIMRDQPTPFLVRLIIALVALVMCGAAIGMFVS